MTTALHHGYTRTSEKKCPTPCNNNSVVAVEDLRIHVSSAQEKKMSGEDTTVFVRFKTKLPAKYIITDDPISVPWNLKRLGLSQVINHLLGTTSKYYLTDAF